MNGIKKIHKTILLIIDKIPFFVWITVSAICFLLATFPSNQKPEIHPNHPPSILAHSTTPQEPLEFNGQKQLILGSLDDLGRATNAHIQLKSTDEPGHNNQKRNAKLTYDPVGWHNYKILGSWLFDRGHLVGYQFSGLNDEARNLVPETHYLNAGKIGQGMDGSNQNSMLYYENHLDSWLELHPNYFLDYQVTPIYQGNELLPRQIRLAYIGLDTLGNYLPISVGGKEQPGNHATVVILDNVSPNVNVDYATGTATERRSHVRN